MRSREEAAVCQKTRPLVKAGAPPVQKPLTYDRFVLAAGWQAVFYDEQAGAHLSAPVQALALGYRRTRQAHTGQRVAQPWLGAPEENWEVFSLTYDPVEDWLIAEEASNYCGLMPPGQTLKEFEALSLCGSAHTTPLSPEEHFDLVQEMYDRQADDGPPSAGMETP